MEKQEIEQRIDDMFEASDLAVHALYTKMMEKKRGNIQVETQDS